MEGGALQGIRGSAYSVPPVTSLKPQEMEDLINLIPETSSGSNGLQLWAHVSLFPTRVQQCL